MRAPRFRLAGLMILVAVIAVPLGIVAERSARQRRRAAAAVQCKRQQDVTLATLTAIQGEVTQEYGSQGTRGNASATDVPEFQDW
jgi:hypothetical protein